MSANAANLARRALSVQKSLGTFNAARFLCKRDVSLEEALFILTGKGI